MKAFFATLAFLALLTWGTTCRAGVMGYAADDGDGAVTCTGTWLAPGLGGEDDGTMLIQGQQWGPVGHIGKQDLDETARFEVNEDPTVKLRTIIDNDTAFAWTAYHVNIYMTQPFSISSVSVNYGDTSEGGWWGSATVTPAQQVGDEYVGQVDFSGGDPLLIGDSLDFSYKLTFTGSVHYCQEMIPIPEPSMIALAISGLVGLLVVRRKFPR